jgi:hypothetical protein
LACAQVGRLLISSLFLYVGVTEILRQLDSTVEHEGHVHRYALARYRSRGVARGAE